jgi:hypothetical protein
MIASAGTLSTRKTLGEVYYSVAPPGDFPLEPCATLGGIFVGRPSVGLSAPVGEGRSGRLMVNLLKCAKQIL